MDRKIELHVHVHVLTVNVPSGLTPSSSIASAPFCVCVFAHMCECVHMVMCVCMYVVGKGGNVKLCVKKKNSHLLVISLR